MRAFPYSCNNLSNTLSGVLDSDGFSGRGYLSPSGSSWTIGCPCLSDLQQSLLNLHVKLLYHILDLTILDFEPILIHDGHFLVQRMFPLIPSCF